MRIAEITYSDGQVQLSRHYHDGHQLLYVVEGEVEVVVGSEQYRMQGGSLLILNRLEEHSIRVLSREYRRYTVRLSSGDASGSALENERLTSILVNRPPQFCHVMELGEMRSAVERLLEKMHSEARAGDAFCNQMQELALFELLILLYRYAPSCFRIDESRNAQMIRSIRQRLEQHCEENYTLSSLASDYHVSPSHLAHSFRQITGYSPMAYLMACRISAAKSDLGRTDLPIREIMERCGFGDESNFSRKFKSTVGMTPSEFRRRYRSSGEAGG